MSATNNNHDVAHLASADAELIQHCDEYADLSRRIAYIYNVEFARDDAGADRTAEPLDQRREELLGLICEVKASTIEGLKVRDRMMVAYRRPQTVSPTARGQIV